jgi:ribosomal-protein-alanine N-acetyltransferase
MKTARLLLRPARHTDAEDLHAVLADSRAMRFWSTPPHATLDQTRAWLEAMIAIPAQDGEDFVIEHEGKVIGKAGLYRFPEIGFILHPDYWQRGFAREALAFILERAFAVHRLAAIEADVDPRNTASLRLLAGLGFVETHRAERTWLVGEEYCDSVYLNLIAHAFGLRTPLPTRPA